VWFRPASILATLAVLAPFIGAKTESAADEGRGKVILDTDIGGDIDDAWALAFVLSHDGFEPLGVTITDGETSARAKVACKLLHAVGRDDVPVAVGRATPVPPGQIDYQFQWAEDFTAKKPVSTPAADFIVETARRQPGEVTLVAVGPLQNVADALRKEPALGRYLKRVVLMSGCIYGSAWGLIAEWNVVASTRDAQVVYGAGLPLTIVPLDSTTLVQLKDEERQKLQAYNSPLTSSLEALYRLWLESPKARMTLHDQMAVAETARPGSFFGRKETLSLLVDDKGFTRIDASKGKPVTVCLEPRRDAFMDYYLGRLLEQRLGLAPAASR
jgi:inosine-uridine nucleoside N-ribohydrolase